MPHKQELTSTLPQLTPPNAFEEMSGIFAGRQPRREFELAEIERKIAEAGLQQKASQEKRLEQDQRLKQFGALSTIAKVINSIGPAIPAEAKSAIAQKLADEATADSLIVTDKRFFDALVNQPNELSKFLDAFGQSSRQGKDTITALTESAQDITDPEVQKLVSETFQKLVVEGVKPQKGPSVGADREALALERGFTNFGEAPKDVQKAINVQVEALEKAKFGAQQQRDITNETRQLRDDFTKASQNFLVGQNSMKRIGQVEQQPIPTVAGDIKLIYSFMKLMDPTPNNSVREGETALAQQAPGIPAQILNTYNSVIIGRQLLPPERRQDMINQARQIHEGNLTDQANLIKEHSRIAKGLGLNPALVIQDFITVKPTPKPPKEGDRQIHRITGEIIEFRKGKWVKVEGNK